MKAIITIFETVPKPGICFNGIQPNKTTRLMKNVHHPSESGECRYIPCANTDQGAFPNVDWISNESPNPKMLSPKKRIKTRPGPSDQRDDAVHEVRGTVLWGRSFERKLIGRE
jgi:hypothetical protein